MRVPKDQPPLAGGAAGRPAPVREAEAPRLAPAPPRGARPRRFLVRFTEDAGAAGLPAALLEALRAHAPDATLFEVDPTSDLPWTELSFLALDTETTGLDPEGDQVIEVAWVRFDRGVEVERFAQLCRADRPLSPAVCGITGIDDAMLAGASPFAALAPRLLEALGQVDFVAAYNAPFDRAFLARELERAGHALPDVPWVDPLVFIKEVDRYKPGKKLADASRRWGVDLDRPHRALADARATGQLLLRVAPFLPARTLAELLEQQERWSERQRAEGPPDASGARPSNVLRDLTDGEPGEGDAQRGDEPDRPPPST